jgi:hypothetical protein
VNTRSLEQNAKLWAMLGLRTSKMTKQQLNDLIELAQAHGAACGVRWG